MRRSLCIAVITAVVLVSQSVSAQDAKAVIANASKAMGADTVNAITIYGSGANFGLGQSNNANGQWPRTNLNDYVRSIDFSGPASRATAVTWIAPVTGGPAVQGAFQQNIAPANNTWAQQLEIWVTPWGFLKGAAANNATVRAQAVDGKRFQVVTWNSPIKAPSGIPYKVVGYINGQNLVERVETWLENPVFGDMLVESIYTEYRDANGVKFPASWVQKRGGQPTFELQTLGIRVNPQNIQALVTPPPPPAGRGGGAGGPGGPGGPGGAPPVTSEKLAEGVYRIHAPYNSLAVEFKDHVLLFEPGPQNEERAQAGIAEVKRLIPNKPIKYGVISHHHFDHSSGLPAVVAAGITIVTSDVNKAFFERALSVPRTLAPDSMSKSGKKPVIETVGDKRVFQDETRTFEVHRIQGLPHADGLLIGYLPKEKILVYADMFNLPPANDPVPNPPVTGTQVFLANIERLKLDPERILSIHNLNPDRLTNLADIRSSLGISGTR